MPISHLWMAPMICTQSSWFTPKLHCAPTGAVAGVPMIIAGAAAVGGSAIGGIT